MISFILFGIILPGMSGLKIDDLESTLMETRKWIYRAEGNVGLVIANIEVRISKRRWFYVLQFVLTQPTAQVKELGSQFGCGQRKSISGAWIIAR